MPVPRTTDQGLPRAASRPALGRVLLTAAGLRAACDLADRAAPSARPASWPPDFAELADKLDRQTRGWCPGGLGPAEDRVSNSDRKILMDMLPPCVEVGMDDPEPYPN